MNFQEEITGFEQLLTGGKLQGRGRPRKGSTNVTYKQLGITRQQVYEWRRLAEIGEDEMKAFLDKCRAETKRTSRRGVLVHFGKRKNVASDDIFADTPTGELAEALLADFERIVPEMTRQQRRWVIRALRARLRAIDLLAEMNE